jgi:hypothetical protein
MGEAERSGNSRHFATAAEEDELMDSIILNQTGTNHEEELPSVKLPW